MSISTETIETALSGMVPRGLDGGLSLSLTAEMDAYTEDSHQLTANQLLLEARLLQGIPQALHPHQFELLNGAQRDGVTESEWSAKFQAVPLNRDRSLEMITQMDSAPELSQMAPASLKPELFEELISKMDAISQTDSSVQDEPAAEGEVLAFPGQRLPQVTKSNSLLKIAAAVALVGAALGIFLPDFQQPTSSELVASPATPAASTVTDSGSAEDSVPSLPAFASLMSPQLVPASLESGVRSPKDQGLVLDGSNQAHRKFEFEQVELLILVDEQGRQREFERPRGKRHCTVPVETN